MELTIPKQLGSKCPVLQPAISLHISSSAAPVNSLSKSLGSVPRFWERGSSFFKRQDQSHIELPANTTSAIGKAGVQHWIPGVGKEELQEGELSSGTSNTKQTISQAWRSHSSPHTSRFRCFSIFSQLVCFHKLLVSFFGPTT